MGLILSNKKCLPSGYLCKLAVGVGFARSVKSCWIFFRAGLAPSRSGLQIPSFVSLHKHNPSGYLCKLAVSV